ncbi:hypothetical protein FHG87_000007 [Trinorchestia longiramus]|nr:hypothetical protein FHG87_000007 [Trinorchestia longiramus]
MLLAKPMDVGGDPQAKINVKTIAEEPDQSLSTFEEKVVRSPRSINFQKIFPNGFPLQFGFNFTANSGQNQPQKLLFGPNSGDLSLNNLGNQIREAFEKYLQQLSQQAQNVWNNLSGIFG